MTTENYDRWLQSDDDWDRYHGSPDFDEEDQQDGMSYSDQEEAIRSLEEDNYAYRKESTDRIRRQGSRV